MLRAGATVVTGIMIALLLSCSMQQVVPQPGQEEAPAKRTITFWKWIPTSLQMRELEYEFELQHPDIDLVVKHIGESDAYFQKLAVGLASGKGPDVIAMQVGAGANRFKAYMEPLRPYAERTWGEDWQQLFSARALEQSAISGEEYVVLPGGMTVTPAIVYNYKMFMDYGLAPPTTLEELKQITLMLRQENPGIISGIGVGGRDGWALRDLFIVIAEQIAPGKMEQAEKGLISWSDPELVESFRTWRSLFESGVFMAGSLEQSVYPQVSQLFHEGKLAMISLGSWQLTGMRRETGSGIVNGPRYGMFPFPSVKAGSEPVMSSTVDIAWAMNKDAEDKEAVWAFIEFMTAGDGQRIWARTLQVLPSVPGIKVDRTVMFGDVELHALDLVLEHVNKESATTRELADPEQQTALFDVLQGLAAKGIDAEEAAARMQSTFERR